MLHLTVWRTWLPTAACHLMNTVQSAADFHSILICHICSVCIHLPKTVDIKPDLDNMSVPARAAQGPQRYTKRVVLG